MHDYHHSTVFSSPSVEDLCYAQALTLSAGKREFTAHKLVLSVCPGYFNDLFAKAFFHYVIEVLNSQAERHGISKGEMINSPRWRRPAT